MTPDVPTSGGTRLVGAVLACHPGPTLTVTGVLTALAAALGRRPGEVALVAAAALTGQLSVGWANDARDAARDRSAARTRKPVVRGMVTPRQLWWAAAVAAVACLPLSLLAGGFVGGGCHLVAVASAWSYDLVLKTTVLSFLPYVVSFGLVPPFLTLGLDPTRPPAWWGVVAFALLGLGAHLANGVPDVEGDRAVGAGGLVARIGPGTARWLATASVLGATVLLVGRILGTGWALTVLAAVLAWTVLAAVRDRGRGMFDAVLVLAVLDAALLCLDASVLVGG